MASVLLSNHDKSVVKRTKLGLQKINEKTAKTINKVLQTPYVPLKRSYNLMSQSDIIKNESNLKSETLEKSLTTTKNEIIKKFGISRSLLLTQNEDYYPHRPKRKIFMKKHDYKVVATTNKRKRRMPHKEINEEPFPMSVPNSNNNGDWSMADLVRLTEEQGIDDDDFMEILTCPSPVWWEDASDDQEESHIRFHEDAAKKDAFNTQLDYTFDNLYEIDKNPLKKKMKEAIITPTLVGNNLKTDQNLTKTITTKQSKLENILGNIKLKISNVIPRNNKNNEIDKSRCKVRKDSESYVSDTSLDEEDLMKTLENIKIPVQKYDSDCNNEDTEVDINVNPKILIEGSNQSNNSKRQKRTKLNNKDKFKKNFNKLPKKEAIKTRKVTNKVIKVNKKLENTEIIVQKKYADIDLDEEETEVNDKTTNLIESYNQNDNNSTKRKTKSNRNSRAKLKQNKTANSIKIKPIEVKKLKNNYIHLKDLDITTDYLPTLTKRPFLNDDKVLCESPKSIDSISDLNNTNLMEPDSISDSNIKFLDESDEKSGSPSKENQINESKSVNETDTKDSDLVTVYRIISNPNIDIEEQIKINLVNKQVSNSSTNKTKDHNLINEYYKTQKLHNNIKDKKVTVKKQNANGISKNVSRYNIKKNIMKIGSKAKYCHNCSSIFDTVTCQYCYKKS